jgi:beta-glucanase (GH16 family)
VLRFLLLQQYDLPAPAGEAGLLLRLGALLIPLFLVSNFIPKFIPKAHAQDPHAAPKPWKLVWSDEFDGDKLDQTKWRVEDAALVKNNEKQYYTPEDVYLKEGKLILRSQKRPMGGREYTSGLVDTRDRFTQKYGRVEVCAKLPKGQGIWPAHWMMANDEKKWPPEIDITEMMGDDPRVVYFSVHWKAFGQHDYDTVKLEDADYSADFHVFAMEWEPKKITWFVDGIARHTQTRHIPNIPMRIIFNTAVGGYWPGYPDETTQFPVYHEIDYVRVYSL